jgi:hypothetical protein
MSTLCNFIIICISSSSIGSLSLGDLSFDSIGEVEANWLESV